MCRELEKRTGQFRFAKADEGTFRGIAVTFDKVDTYGTTFDRGAFDGFDGRWLPLFWGHFSDEAIGSVRMERTPRT